MRLSLWHVIILAVFAYSSSVFCSIQDHIQAATVSRANDARQFWTLAARAVVPWGLACVGGLVTAATIDPQGCSDDIKNDRRRGVVVFSIATACIASLISLAVSNQYKWAPYTLCPFATMIMVRGSVEHSLPGLLKGFAVGLVSVAALFAGEMGSNKIVSSINGA
jgi:hypothetical protein